MIISRESRKSRKIIHRYRSYVAVWMANASEMMRFRVICEIRVRQKSCVKREYFYNAFSLKLLKNRAIDGDHSRICSPTFTRMVATIHADGRHQSHMNPCKTGNTHYENRTKKVS